MITLHVKDPKMRNSKYFENRVHLSCHFLKNGGTHVSLWKFLQLGQCSSSLKVPIFAQIISYHLHTFTTPPAPPADSITPNISVSCKSNIRWFKRYLIGTIYSCHFSHSFPCKSKMLIFVVYYCQLIPMVLWQRSVKCQQFLLYIFIWFTGLIPFRTLYKFGK